MYSVAMDVFSNIIHGIQMYSIFHFGTHPENCKDKSHMHFAFRPSEAYVQRKETDGNYVCCISVHRPVSLRLMTSQFKEIVTHTQKLKTVKCIFCGVWVQNFVWNFKGALWNFTQNFEPIHRKICILRGAKNLTTYDILELWHLKS